jgi:membrane fusion protein (multidrug efflux system)
MSVEKNPRLRNNRAARDLVVKGNKAGNLKNGLPRRVVVIGILIAIPAIFFGVRYWSYTSTHEDTDDAYVTGYTHQISSRITGTVEKVLVDDNWHVSAGQPLLELDPRDYEVALEKDRAQLRQSIAQKDQARAGVEQANADLLQRQAQIKQAQAQVIQAQANFDIAQINYNRDSSLFRQDLKAVAKEDVDTTHSSSEAARGALEAAKATLEANKAQVAAAQAAVDSASSQVANAEADVAVNQAIVRDAELQLSYCTVIAPVSGRIAQKTVQTGNRVSVGQALMAVVEDNVWILANLKETQLERVRVGQPVDIKIDALPHYRFSGRVDSLQPGTGSNFALLPPDNATGNFIKIVQRVPVKILFDPESIKSVRDKIVPGLSAVPSIAVNEKPIDRPYPEVAETEKPSHQLTNQPITQIQGVPATGVMQ